MAITRIGWPLGFKSGPGETDVSNHSGIATIRDSSGVVTDVVDGTGSVAAAVVGAAGVARPANSRAVRIFAHRFGTLDNSTQKTFHVACELQQDFDAVSVVLANTSETVSYYWLLKLSVAAELGDGNNSAGTWSSVTDESGDTAIPTPVAPKGRVSYRITPPFAINSLARTDGGKKPLLFCRAYGVDTGVSALPVYGNGTSDDYAGWVSRTDGRIWIARQQNGDGITTPANFTSTTDVDQSPIIGFVYWSRGRVVTIATCGDSAADGRGTVIGEGWAVPLANAIASESGVPVEYSNFSAAGQAYGDYTTTGIGFGLRAMDILREQLLRPDCLFMPNGTYNSAGTAPLIDSEITPQETVFRRVLETAASAQVPVLAYTWMPWTSGDWDASDALRVAYNAETLASYPSGSRTVRVVDFSTAVSGPVVDGQVTILPAYDEDTVHLNDAGNAALVPVALSTARQLLGV